MSDTTTPDLSQYNLVLEGFDQIQLNDYEVCRHLGSYFTAAVDWVEQRDLLVRKLAISPEWIRAYPEVSEGALAPEYIEIRLPKGVYERVVDLSCGPLAPFPVAGPSEKVKIFLGRLHQIAFPADPKAAQPQHVVMSASDYADVRKWLSRRFDISTQRAELMLGLQGVLWDTEAMGGTTGRSVKLWVSRSAPIGSVATATRQPPPNWGDLAYVRLSEEPAVP